MPANSADVGSCTITVPPRDFTAPTPIAPSRPVPVNTQATARGPYAPATDSNSRSADGRTKWTNSLLVSVSWPAESTSR